MAQSNELLSQLKIQINFLKRSRRATFRIDPDGQIKLTVPAGTRSDEINRLLQLKKNWILKKIDFFKTIENPPEKAFTTGELFPYLGKNYTLKIINGKKSVQLDHDQLIVSVPAGKEKDPVYIRRQLIRWYQKMALPQLMSRVKDYSTLLNVVVHSVRIKNYQSRWGTCTSKGQLMFNWQIILFEPLLFDYVVAHEVCHLKEMNHSPRFYQYLTQLGFNKNEVHARMRKQRNLF
jgi:predicted metal-dependent hydrolase